jgi:hypothetical protein
LEEAKCLFLRCRSPPASSIEELIKEIFGYEPYTDNAIDIIKHTKKVFGDFRNNFNNDIDALVTKYKERQQRQV